MFVIGITGGLATGKSSVAKMFKDKGAAVLDADKIVHELLSEDKTAISKIVRTFGKIVNNEGRVNRKELAKIVFSNPKKLKTLEKIIHPLVRKSMEKSLKELSHKKEVVVCEVPLLFEAGFNTLCDMTLVVNASPTLQVKRAVGRLHITKREALKRIQAQMPLKDKIRLADVVINNNSSLKNTQKQVEMICQKIRRMKKK